MKSLRLVSVLLSVFMLSCNSGSRKIKNQIAINISFPDSISEQSIDGRLLLIFADNSKSEPRFQVSEGLNAQPVFGINLNNSPMALPRGFQTYLPLRGGRNCLFAIPGGAKYKISVFGPEAKMKPAKYPYGLPRG